MIASCNQKQPQRLFENTSYIFQNNTLPSFYILKFTKPFRIYVISSHPHDRPVKLGFWLLVVRLCPLPLVSKSFTQSPVYPQEWSFLCTHLIYTIRLLNTSDLTERKVIKFHLIAIMGFSWSASDHLFSSFTCHFPCSSWLLPIGGGTTPALGCTRFYASILALSFHWAEVKHCSKLLLWRFPWL